MLFKRVAMIAGSGGGIGDGVAKKLNGLGGSVVIIDADQAKVDRVVQEIIDNSREVMGIVADITRFDEVKNMFKAIVGGFGLVNNAIQLPKGELLVD